MADNDQVTNDQTQQPPIIVTINPQDAVRAEQAAYAQAMVKAEQEQKDETVEGGRYRLPSGVFVDAEGKKHKDQKSE
jgi:hypothetical protein